LPRKCETVSSSVSQAGQRLVVDLLIMGIVRILAESAVSCDDVCSAVRYLFLALYSIESRGHC
jgi:hypothetical protein